METSIGNHDTTSDFDQNLFGQLDSIAMFLTRECEKLYLKRDRLSICSAIIRDQNFRPDPAHEFQFPDGYVLIILLYKTVENPLNTFLS